LIVLTIILIICKQLYIIIFNNAVRPRANKIWYMTYSSYEIHSLSYFVIFSVITHSLSRHLVTTMFHLWFHIVCFVFLAPPSAIVSPQIIVKGAGQTVEFTCDVTGSPAPTVQWGKENGNLPERHIVQGSKLT